MAKVGGGGVAQLGAAIGSAVAEGAKQRERERQARLAQMRTDAINSIVLQAIDMQDRMAAAGKPEYLINRDVFKFIANRERSSGLPIGQAGKTFKEFFSEVTPEGATQDLADASRQDRIGNGVQYTFGDGRQIYVPDTEEAIKAQRLADSEKAAAKVIQDRFFATPEAFNMSPTKASELFQASPWKAMQDPTMYKSLKYAADLTAMSEAATFYSDAETVDLKKSVRDYQQYGTPTHLTNVAEDLRKLGDSKGLPLNELKSRFQAQVNEWRKANPRAFDTVAGDLVKELDNYLTLTHSTTKFKELVGKEQDREQYLKSRYASIVATAKVKMASEKPELINTEIMLDLLRNINPAALGAINKSGAGDYEAVLTDIGHYFGSVGVIEAGRIAKRESTEAVNMMLRVSDTTFSDDPEVEKDDEVERYLMDVLMAVGKGTNTFGPDDLKLANAITASKENKNAVLDALNRLILNPPMEFDTETERQNHIEVVTKLKDMIVSN